METKIFIDTDGIIRDFVGACEKRYRFNLLRFSEKTNLQTILAFSDEEWKKELDNYNFWKAMPLTQDAKSFMEVIKKYFKKSNVYFVSSSQQTPSALAGCAAWYEKHLKSFKERTIFIKDKFLLAEKEHLLIDDHYKTCVAWMQKGGHAILYPRPWNMRKQCVFPIQAIEDEIRSILKIKED
jgi:hypothetical protein